MPRNQHPFLVQIDSPIALVRQVAFAQQQAATFLASAPAEVIDPGPGRFFGPLFDLSSLEDLDYIPRAGPGPDVV